MWNHDNVKRVNTVMKLEETNPTSYCWANLYLMSVETDSEERLSYKEEAKDGVKRCKKDAGELGHCWCGKFTK